MVSEQALSDLCFKCNLLLLRGDAELNPRPKQNTGKNLLSATGTSTA